ncbi:MAG: excinuclease ABC subunit UvrC [Candidatus Omnitrophica bacterium]|nr:excinuclease ABC subunit UvrC [Candidatus Omnitrophota bacterium]
MAGQTAGVSSLRRRVAHLPDQPGVYLFRDAQGRLLYVGKALSLRKRVASYFRTARPLLSPRIARMMTMVADLETRQTASEAEALLLEAQLIKDLTPYYNVTFRDDKRYPMLKITNEPFPRLVVARRKLDDAAHYFGPYTEATLMHQAVRFLRRVFPMRTCKTFPKSPCLEYHLGQCLAPCVGYVTPQNYQRMVDDLVAFLEGKRERLLRDLSRRMTQAASHRRFEEAARVRDQIQALTSIIVAKEKSLVAGPLEQLQAALTLPQLPRRIEAFDISNIFGDFAVGSMVVFVDGKPHKAHYRRFTIQTAQGISAKGGSAYGGDDYQMMREVIRRRYSGSLATARPPGPPGSKAGAGGAREGRAGELPLPDLILVDGGKGQLAAACEELTALSLTLPIMGLAKRFEQIFLPGSQEPVVLLPTSPVLHLVQHVRDEAHRFAITFHRQRRQRAVTASALDAVAGVGPRRKLWLLREFGSLEGLRRASAEDVARAGRCSRALAETILQRLHAR